MVVFEDLLTYQKGIYIQKDGEIIGAHAILIIGFGVDEKGIKYWEVQNSWGQDWGENGYFKIKMDECMVANEAFGGAFSCKAKSYSDEETLNNQIFLSL